MIALSLIHTRAQLPGAVRWLCRDDRMPGHPAGAQSWRASRWAAKTTARYVLATHGRTLALRHIRVRCAPSGEPRAVFAQTNRQWPLSISLSHSGKYAFAAARASKGAGSRPATNDLGVDVAPLDGQAMTLAKRFLHPEEREALTLHRATILWTLKEAAMKATGGASLRFCDYVVHWNRRIGHATIHCNVLSAAAPLRAWYGLHDGHAWAVAVRLTPAPHARSRARPHFITPTVPSRRPRPTVPVRSQLCPLRQIC